MQVLRRSRRRWPLLVAAAGVCAVLAGVLAGLATQLDGAQLHGIRADLGARGGQEVALEASLQLDPADADGQDAAMRAAIADALDGVPLDVRRTVASGGTLAAGVDGRPDRVTAAQVDDLPSIATLVAGRWPVADDGVTLQADAAAVLGATVGSNLELGDTTATVTGLWRLDDPGDPRFAYDPLLSTGFDGTRVGPVIVDAASWSRIDPDAVARWSIVPVIAQIDAADLRAVSAGWSALPRAVEAAGLPTVTLDQRGRLVRTANELAARLDALDAVRPVATLAAGLVGLIALLELARLLTLVRADETALLWARGATPVAIGGVAAGEALIAGAVGGAVPAVLIGDPIVPMTVAVLAAAIFGVTAWSAARSAAGAARLVAAGRTRRLAAPGVLVLVAVAAAVCTGQLLLYGGPVAPARGGGTRVDPIAVLAPGLLLLAVAMLGLAVVPLLARLAERWAAGSRGLGGVQVARTLARRLPVVAAPVLLCALAVGQLVTAGVYAQTWQEAFDTTRALRAGTAIRVVSDTGALPVELAAGLGGAPVISESTTIGAEETTIIALTPDALRELATDRSFDPEAAAEALSGPIPDPVLPSGGGAMTIEIAGSGLTSPPTVVAIVTDALGARHRVTERMPDAQGLRLSGFEITVDADPDAAPPPFVSVTEVRVDGEPISLGDAWAAVSIVGAAPDALGDGPTPRAGLAGGEEVVRLVPVGDGETPVVISQPLAQRNGIEVGDRLQIVLDPRSSPTPCTVRAIVPVVPGAVRDSAVLVDVRTLQSQRALTDRAPASAQQVWLRDAPSGLPAGTRVVELSRDPARAMLGSTVGALWAGAIGAAVLAATALAAVVAAQLGTRRRETVLLRAVGAGAASIGAGRAVELAVVVITGMLLGVASGAVVALVVVGDLARAAVPGAYPVLGTELALAGAPLALALLGLVAALAVIVVTAGAAVTRQARGGRMPDAR